MLVKEMLINCFDGQELVGTVYLDSTADTVRTILTDVNGKAIADEARKGDTEAFEAILEILDRLVKVPAGARP